MRILKEGIEKFPETFIFKCGYCGCEFEADQSEFERCNSWNRKRFGLLATCRCPNCGDKCCYYDRKYIEEGE